MTDLKRIIMDDIEGYSYINATDIGIEEKTEGFLKRRKSLHIFGVVNSEEARAKVDEIVHKHARENIAIVNELKVDEKLV